MPFGVVLNEKIMDYRDKKFYLSNTCQLLYRKLYTYIQVDK